MLYDQKRRKGVLYNKLIYHRQKAFKRTNERTQHVASTSKRVKSNDGSDRTLNNSDDYCDDLDGFAHEPDETLKANANVLILFFQTCTLPKDASKVKQKFEETIQLRKKMITSVDEYKQLFDLFLIMPDLVRYIFIRI